MQPVFEILKIRPFWLIHINCINVQKYNCITIGQFFLLFFNHNNKKPVQIPVLTVILKPVLFLFKFIYFHKHCCCYGHSDTQEQCQAFKPLTHSLQRLLQLSCRPLLRPLTYKLRTEAIPHLEKIEKNFAFPFMFLSNLVYSKQNNKRNKEHTFEDKDAYIFKKTLPNLFDAFISSNKILCPLISG